MLNGIYVPIISLSCFVFTTYK